jgi:hypothetical protein
MRSRRELKPRRIVRALALLGLLALAGVFYATVAEPHIAKWGSTSEERATSWPGDRFISDPGYTWTNAVTIHRPASEVWPWVVQLGQGRGGLYSYDWLENAIGCDVRSTDQIQPRFQQTFSVGEKVIRMCSYAPHNPVALFVPGRALVLGDTKDSASELAAGRASMTWAFIVHPIDEGTSRLIVRSRGDSFSARIQEPLQFVMQRRLMLGIAERAEGVNTTRTETWEPILWLLAGALLVVGAVRVLVQRTRWLLPLAVTAAAFGVLFALMFWRPPFAVGVVLDVLLALSLLLSARRRADRPPVASGLVKPFAGRDVAA